MPKPNEEPSGNRKVIASVFDRQWFVVARAQLTARGVAESAIHPAVASGRLFVAPVDAVYPEERVMIDAQIRLEADLVDADLERAGIPRL